MTRGIDPAADHIRTALASLSPGPQIRVRGLDPAHAAVLADLPTELPPIVVRRDTMQVVDGRHRVRAAELRGEDTIRAVLVDGDDVDALVLAVRLNGRHGLPLTRRDRAAAVDRLLQARPHWSDRRIAEVAGVSHRTVGSARHRSGGQFAQTDVVGRDGRVWPRDPAGRRRRAAALLDQRPDASAREVARSAGLSPTTVGDVRRRRARGLDAVPGGGARASPPPEDPGTSLQALLTDPSLRYSLVGRSLLRLLSATLGLHDAGHLATAVPEHSRATLAALARESAERWLRVAGELEKTGERARSG